MLDTKLKNNNKRIWLVILITALIASVVYIGFYPYFNSRANKKYELWQEQESFLRDLFKFNFCLYYDIEMGKEQKQLSYSDVYYDFTESDSDLVPNYDYETISGRMASERSNLNGRASEWDSQFAAVSPYMDYCSIDKETGKINKNSTRNIEDLLDAEAEEKERIAQYFDFYVLIDYDENGSISNFEVKSQNPDTVIKVLKMISRESTFFSGGDYFRQGESYCYATETGAVKAVELNVHGPRNACFIYGYTQEQLEVVAGGDSSTYYSQWDQLQAYIEAGAVAVYTVILIILAILAFILPGIFKYNPRNSRFIRVPMEISVFVILYLFTGSTYRISERVAYSNMDYYRQGWLHLLELNAQAAFFFNRACDILYLAVGFAVWLVMVSSYLELRQLGVKEFIKQRSLCCRLYKYYNSTLQEWYHRFREFDLSQDANRKLIKILILNLIILAVICIFWIFGIFLLIPYTAVLYYILRKHIKKLQAQYQCLSSAAGRIAAGDLDTEIEGDFGIFTSYQEELKEIRSGFKKAVEEEVKSQQMKTELITNVSHDLKTPLTAIITYIDLLKDEHITPEERKVYIDTLERKSLRLKVLIEDLFEVSKANSKNVTLDLVEVDIINLMKQVRNELSGTIEDSGLLFRWNLPDEKVVLLLDSQKTYRIFENLYSNILKYAMPGTRVYIDAVKTEKGVRIELKNISAHELDVDVAYLTERFVRGDSSRNTEGSGLGLAIARSFVELQKGKMGIEVDGDLFKVILEWW